MYLSFYGLTKQPFHITPDPEFLYLSPSHKEALSAILYGIEQKKGFISVTGSVGVGKTTILRSYLESVDKERFKVIYVFNARLTFDELLTTIYRELGLPIKGNDTVEMLNNLYDFLIREYEQGNTVVLVIDEVQNMPVDTLENLRMISNLETSRDKLIQIVLVGQQEFEEKLGLDRLRQLKQRLAVRSTIQPLTKNESLDYISFRLKRAGATEAIFSSRALKTIVKKAKGIPRSINVLCDNALITAFGYSKQRVTKKIVQEIARDFDSSGHWVPGWSLLTAGSLVALFAGAACLLWQQPPLLDRIGAAAWGRSPASYERKMADRTLAEARPAMRFSVEGGPVQPVVRAGETASSSGKKRSRNVVRTVRTGDTLTKLSQEVYGDSGADTIKVIRDHNPQITNPNLIHSGGTIVFPDIGRQSWLVDRHTRG